MAYLMLAVAVGAEIAATTLLKYSDGFTKLYPTVGCIIAYVICYTSFSKSLEKLNLGVAYATWCGVGIVATALISAFFFKERLTTAGVAGIVLIVTGCVLMNLYGQAG